jgi:hypothetical protein
MNAAFGKGMGLVVDCAICGLPTFSFSIADTDGAKTARIDTVITMQIVNAIAFVFTLSLFIFTYHLLSLFIGIYRASGFLPFSLINDQRVLAI